MVSNDVTANTEESLAGLRYLEGIPVISVNEIIKELDNLEVGTDHIALLQASASSDDDPLRTDFSAISMLKIYEKSFKYNRTSREEANIQVEVEYFQKKPSGTIKNIL